MKKSNVIAIKPDFYQIGTPAYPAYLSLGKEGMIIEGGTGATFRTIVEQLKELGIEPDRIQYIAITHTHPDHIGAVPHLQKIWPHLKVIAGQVAANDLQAENMIKDFLRVDNIINENLMVKGELDEWPPEPQNPVFKVDKIVKEGDKIDLGKGIVWTVYETPGHSASHISFFDEKEGIVDIGDATGLYNPDKDVFWPNYFESLEDYCHSIKKLAALPTKLGALSHNGIIKGNVFHHFEKALRATEDYHNSMLKRVEKGEVPRQVAFETARHVYTFTNMQPFEVIFGLCRLMLKRSQAAAGKEDLFKLK
jgi:2-aminobenzoylacetyl-CoA thioesterase